MKKGIIAAICALLITAPGVSSAYTTTSQTALRLSDTKLLFLVTYQFGHEDFSYRMPIRAKRSEGAENAVTYDILKDGKLRTLEGESMGIILSDAVVEEGKYLIEKDQSETFTLLAVLDLPKERPASSTDYALQISALPFQLNKTDEWQQNHLHESELEAYRTAVIGTDKRIGITTH